jgi:hypothetical protein
VTAVDPGAAWVMSLANDLMVARGQVRRLQRRIWGLMVVVHSQQATNRALADLVYSLLTAEPGRRVSVVRPRCSSASSPPRDGCT